MQTATQLPKELRNTTNITSGKITTNPLQLKQPANNPLQFTREQAKHHQPKVVVDDLETYFKNDAINNNQKLIFIFINNYGLLESDKDYIDMEKAIALMPEYEIDSLSDAMETYLDWEAQQNIKKEEPTNQEKAEPDKDEKYMGVLPTLKLADRSITLIGTAHGADKPDYTPNITNSTPNDAAIVLEYPSLTNTDRDTYTSNDIKNVNDNTQASLANNANGRKVIGSDGRKAFDKKQTLHSISIRHKKPETFEINAEYIEDKEIQLLATNYVHAALGIEETEAKTVSIPIEALVKYLDGTLSLFVLTNTFSLVRKLSKKLSADRKTAIAGKVIQALNQDLTDLEDRYASHLKETIKHLATIQPEQERDKEKSKLKKATAAEFTGNKISFLHDAVCNVLLFTEVIASDKNMVVAFGAHHIGPLQELVEEVEKPTINTTDSNEPAKDEEKIEPLQSGEIDLKGRLHKLILQFLQIEMSGNLLGINNCLIKAILDKLKIDGETKEKIILSIRKSLAESGIPKSEMLHATAGVLNLIAHEIRNETGISIGTVTVYYKHISNEIQKNIEHMDNTQLNNLLDNITDDIIIGNGQNISITHTGFAHFE